MLVVIQRMFLDVDLTYRPSELVEKTTSGNGQVGEGHTLGTHLERQDLDGVERLKWSDAETVDDGEDVDQSLSGLGRRRVGLVGLSEEGRGNGNANPNGRTSSHAEEEQETTSESVSEGSTDDSNDEGSASDTKGNVLLVELVGDANGVEDGREVVGEHGITSPLAPERDHDVDTDPVARGSVAEQSAVVPPALVGSVELEVLLVLMELECYPNAVRVAVAVVLDKEILTCLLLAVDVVPARRLWHDPDTGDDNTGEEQLKPDREEPGLVACHVETSTSGTGSNNGTDEPASCQCIPYAS